MRGLAESRPAAAQCFALNARIVSASWFTVRTSATRFIGIVTSKRSSSSITMSMMVSESTVVASLITVSPLIGCPSTLNGASTGNADTIASVPAEMLTAMKKALKPDGALVFIEFRAEDDTVPIKPEHKMTKAQLTKELEANGYKLVKQFDALPWQHMMWFERE